MVGRTSGMRTGAIQHGAARPARRLVLDRRAAGGHLGGALLVPARHRPRRCCSLVALLVGVGLGATPAPALEPPAHAFRLESFALDDGRLKVELFVAPEVPPGAMHLELPAGSVPLGACAGDDDACGGGRGRVRRARRFGVHGRRVTLVAPLPNAAKLARAVSPDRPVLVSVRVDDRPGATSVVVECRERGRGFVCGALPPPHVLLVVVGAQAAAGLDALPAVSRELVGRGLRFPDTFATTPVGAPSRASLLSGLYAHHHGVRTDRPPDGGASAFVGADASTLATWLAAAGYRTGHFGIYLDAYWRLGPPARATWYVPPGWQRWLAFAGRGADAELVDERGRLHDPAGAATSVLAAAARAWIEDARAARRPVFVQLAPAELRGVDEAVDGLLALLGARDTLVIYTAARGAAGPAPCASDACLRVPLVVRHPPVMPAGAALPVPVEHVDLAPTIAALAGVLRPGRVDGRDLVPLIAGAAARWRSDVLLQAWALGPDGPGGFLGVRSAGWKLVRDDDGAVALYDLAADPAERQNLAGEPAQATRRAALERLAETLAAAAPSH